MGLLRGVADAVRAAVERRGATRVEAVGLRVGALSGALPEALRGAWPIATSGTALEGALLDLELVPAKVWCPGCRAEQDVDEFYALCCPVCGTPTANLVSGREFEVAWADMDVPPSTDAHD